MQPIICPNCQTEVIPHETHKQRLQDCFEQVLALFGKDFSQDNNVKIALNFFNEINDFIISDNIAKQKMDTTKQIQSYKVANIKKMGEQ